jgi:hypothetical protein
MSPTNWKEDLRFWLRQQQAWHNLRNLLRESAPELRAHLFTWRRILDTPPMRTAPAVAGGPVEYHMVCHNGDWLWAVWMLKSLMVQLPEKPQLIIHIENALRPSSMAKLQYHFPDARIIQPEAGKAAVARQLMQQGLSHCLHWFHRSPMMYKLFAPQVQAASTNLIVLDPDILFFKAPTELMAVGDKPLPDYTFQHDVQESYTISCQEAKRTLGIDLVPRANAGMILRAKAALDLRRVEEFLKSPLVAIPDVLLEQTLQALCASERQAVRFLPPAYVMSQESMPDLSAPVCRHYAGSGKKFFATEGLPWLIRQGLLEKLRG